jgi:Na+-driven multidrug efflux pump
MIYTRDKDLIAIFVSNIFLLVPISFNDLLQGAEQGILRGIGYQNYATILNLLGYWGITLPIVRVTEYVDCTKMLIYNKKLKIYQYKSTLIKFNDPISLPPIAYYLGYHKSMGYRGVWTGVPIGAGFIAISYYCVI